MIPQTWRFLAALAWAVWPSVLWADLPSELRDKLTHATVYIESQISLAQRDWAALPAEAREAIGARPGGPSSGSGFLVSEDGYILTNAHVIQGMAYLMQFDGKQMRPIAIETTLRPRPFDPLNPQEPFTLQFTPSSMKVVVDSGMETERVYTPTVVRVDSEIDLALLKIGGTEPFTFLTLDPKTEVNSGMVAIMTGFPGGTAPDVAPFAKASNAASLKNKNPRMSLNVGGVSAIREHEGEIRYQMAIGANHGNSGGPISNEKGDVIAVLYAGIDAMQAINYAIPIRYASRVCTTELRQKLGLDDSDADGPADSSDDGGQSFAEFLNSARFNFGEKPE